MKLYEINKQLDDVLKDMEIYAAEHDGEIDPVFIEKLSEIELAKGEKLLNVAKFMKGIGADIDAFDNEIDKLKKRKEALNKKYDWLFDYIYNNAEKGRKVEDSTTVIKWTKSSSVLISDINLLPKKYIRKTIIEEPDKKLIKEALNNNKAVIGCSFLEKDNMQIK